MAGDCPICRARIKGDNIPLGQFSCSDCGLSFCSKHINSGRCTACRELLNSLVARPSAKVEKGKVRVTVKKVFER